MGTKRRKSEMQIITINLPEQFIDDIQIMVDLGLYDSKSQFVRESLLRWLERESEFLTDIDPNNFEDECKEFVEAIKR